MGLENPIHIAFVLVIVLLVFGAKRVPEVGRSLGNGIREFKDSITGVMDKPAELPRETSAPVGAAPVAPQPPAEPPVAPQPPAEPPAAAVAGSED
jgi:sec-independent protein translocase protein TatA